MSKRHDHQNTVLLELFTANPNIVLAHAAEQAGCSEYKARLFRRALGIKPPRPPRTINPARLAAVSKQLGLGEMTVTQAARKLGCSVETVRRRLEIAELNETKPLTLSGLLLRLPFSRAGEAIQRHRDQQQSQQVGA